MAKFNPITDLMPIDSSNKSVDESSEQIKVIRTQLIQTRNSLSNVVNIIKTKNSLLDRFRLISGLPKEKPIAGLYKILTISENKKFNGKLFPKRKGQGSLSGQSPLMNRSTIDLLFPVPDSLPNEDTWLEVAFRHTNLVDLYHSDVICCYWRMHEGNSQNMAMPYAIYKKNKL